MNDTALLKVSNLKVTYPLPRSSIFEKKCDIKAVDDVTFELKKGETLGLVGESGCGKSTLGRAIIQLLRSAEGEVVFNGQSLTRMWRRRFGHWSQTGELRSLRRRMQMIFQDPYSSLNPRMTVEEIVGEPLATHGVLKGKRLRSRVQELLRKVGLNPAYVRRYPHEFSGGQRQRIGIARAIALEPELIIADEPISALDVSIQAQILNLLKALQRDMGLTMVFIAHDLAAVRHVSDKIAVMYLGKIVEMGETQKIMFDPIHPYTRALIAANPIPDPELESKRKGAILEGEIPSPVSPPSGCAFHTRCPLKQNSCQEKIPELRSISNHLVACDLA